jgi:acyl dehydratase
VNQHIELEFGPPDAVSLALYAAASGDHNPLHLDPSVAKAAGYERPVAHGMLTMAYVGRLLTSHFGVSALRSLSTRFTGVVLSGDRLTITATLESQDGSTATYRLRATNAKSQEVLTGVAVISRGGPSTQPQFNGR